jgi:hypothetical protein
VHAREVRLVWRHAAAANVEERGTNRFGTPSSPATSMNAIGVHGSVSIASSPATWAAVR